MPFKPGQSGNPNGRPPLPPDALHRGDIRSWGRKVFEKHGRQAIEDELERRGPYWFKCAELILAYAYGKPTQPLEASGTLTVEHVDSRTVDNALDYAAQRRSLRAVS
jgi:hypothetical protein